MPVVFELCLAAALRFAFEGIALLVEGRVGGDEIDGFGVEASEDVEVVAQVEGVELEIRRLRRTIVREGEKDSSGYRLFDAFGDAVWYWEFSLHTRKPISTILEENPTHCLRSP